MFRTVLMFCLIVICSSAASAAIIYAPVQYQYRDPANNGPAFYYGGGDPAVIGNGTLQQRRYSLPGPIHPTGGKYLAEGRLGFDPLPSGILENRPAVTYTDLLAPGINAYPYGFSVDDARNEAYSNSPLYFRKRDLLRSAYQAPDGNIMVPAGAPAAGTIEIKPYHAPTTQPSSQPTAEPILIIPKGLLNKPLRQQSTPVASAR